MRRRPFSLFAIAWLLAAGVLLGVTVGSHWRAGFVAFRTGDRQQFYLAVQNGSIWGHRQTLMVDDVAFRAFVTEPFNRARGPLGVDWGFHPRSAYVAVPVWFCSALCVGMAWRAQRRYRRRLLAGSGGRCLQCGYDLRATPGRCPECGRVPAGQAGAGTP